MGNINNHDYNYSDYKSVYHSKELSKKQKLLHVPLSFFRSISNSVSTSIGNLIQKKPTQINESIKTSDVYMSYRDKVNQTTKFINVDEVLEKEDPIDLLNIYEEIFKSVTAYEVDSVNTFEMIEEKFYNRILYLVNEEGDQKPNIQNNIQKLDQIHAQFQEKIGMMKMKGIKKVFHPKSEVLRKLEKKRFNNIGLELKRLKAIPRINESLEKILTGLKNSAEKHLKDYSEAEKRNPNFSADPDVINRKRILNNYLNVTEAQQVAIAHSIELQEALKETHYVFNHGQNLNFLVKNILIRELNKVFKPELFPSFDPLRADNEMLKNQQNPEWFQNEMRKNKKSDHDFRDELISGDCFLESISETESALYFFMDNKNMGVLVNDDFLKNMMLKIINHYIPDPEVALKLGNSLISLVEKLSEGGGNIYSFCIPKEDFDNSCYISKPFGQPYSAEEQIKIKAELESLQSGDLSQHSLKDVPQIRILTHKIRPEEGYYVILNSTMNNNKLLDLEEEIAFQIQAALTGYVFDNPKSG